MVAKPNIVDLTAQIPRGHYTPGRAFNLSQISEHHAVGDAIHAINKAKTQEFSTTFTIALDGTIYQLVSISDTPWCDNDWRSNGRSVTIEHAGGLLPNYPYTEAMYQSSIKLHAWLFQTYGQLNCVRHRDIPEIRADRSKATACCGDLDVDRIVREANNLLVGGDEAVITNSDNEYARWRQLGWYIRGRELSREEFKAAAVGQTWLKAMEILCDNEEAQQAHRAQDIGQVAIKDNWPGQIYGLQDQLKAATAKLDELAKNPSPEKYAEAQKAVEACEIKAQDLSTKLGERPNEATLPTAPAETKTSLLTKFLALILRRKK